MKNMKHWKLLHVFSTFNIGGPQVRTCDIIQNLDERFEHTILAMDGQYLCQDHLISHSSVTISDIHLPKKKTIQNVIAIRKLLQSIRPDLLLTYNWGAIEWVMAHSLSRVCPILHAEDGFNHDELQKQKSSRLLIRKLFLKRCDRVVVPSLTLQEIAEKKWKIPSHTIAYIPNGIEYERFFQARSFDPQQTARIVGIVTTIRSVKNIGRLIRAFGTLPKNTPFELWIVGDGSERENLENLSREMPNATQIRFLGKTNNPAPLLKKMDVFALSSDSEQMPISLLEAMAAGCAVISTDVGDIRQMLAEENRPFVLPLSQDGLYANALRTLLESPELCLQLGKKNQEKCLAEYTKERMLGLYEKVYLELLEKNPKRLI